MPRITSFKDAAERLSVPTYLVRRLARLGLISVLEIPGASPRVDVDEIKLALQRHTRPPVVPTGGLELQCKAG